MTLLQFYADILQPISRSPSRIVGHFSGRFIKKLTRRSNYEVYFRRRATNVSRLSLDYQATDESTVALSLQIQSLKFHRR